MSSRAAFIQLLVIQCLILRFCLALTYQTLGLDSGLYIVDSPWAIHDGQFTTTHGTIIASFKGSHFTLQGPYNPNASLSMHIDGYYTGTQPDGSFNGVNLDEGDHQVTLVVQAPEEAPYIFRGIGLPVYNNVNLNATTDYIPQTYGLSASIVPAGTIVMDDTDPCVQFSTGWYQSRDWKSYNETLMVSNESPSTLTIHFLGRSIWLFSSQNAVYYPELASISGTIDSENIADLLFASSRVTTMPVTQKLLWSRTNLTNTLHVLKLNVSHSTFDAFSFDFARVEGKPMDCDSLAASSDHSLSWGTTEIALLVCVSSLFPIIFISCIFFFRWRQSKRLQRDKQGLSYSEKQSDEGKSLDISDDSSSFRTILNRPRRTGIQGPRLESSNEAPPGTTNFPKVMVTPFGPAVLGENEEPYHARWRNGKNPDIHPRPASSDTGDATPDAISEIIESEEVTGSQISSLSPIPSSLALALSLPHRYSDSSLSPPPSYRTELQSRRLVGQAQLLTQEDLGRLVDRVSVLRGWRRPSNAMGIREEEDPFVDEEDDAVEMLARQIAESGSLASDGTRLRTETDLE